MKEATEVKCPGCGQSITVRHEVPGVKLGLSPSLSLHFSLPDGGDHFEGRCEKCKLEIRVHAKPE